MFINLHGHSTHSFLDGFGTEHQIAERLVELGQTACAITDHGNTFAHRPIAKVFPQYGVKPIYGVEFYICDTMIRKERYEQSHGGTGNAHITVLAYNEQGYRNLLELTSLAYREGFYYKPRIDHDLLCSLQDGLIVMSGCVSGYPSTFANNGKYEELYKYMGLVKQKIEHYYCELIPEPGLDISEQSFPVIIKVANELGIPFVMTSDAHFPSAKDHVVQDVLLCAGLRKKFSDEGRIQLPSFQYYCTEEELLQRAKDTTRACLNDYDTEFQQGIDNTSVIADMCEFELPKQEKMYYFDSKIKKETTTEAKKVYLYSLAMANLETLPIDHDKKQIYIDNINKELDVFASKDFLDYILMVWDIVNYARSLNSLVVTRGSAGGSTLLFALGTSVTDPIVHDLSFERFYDYNRNDPPDVDIDFAPAIRDKTIEYIENKYGKENVCRLAALAKLKPKNALRDLAFVYDLPSEDIDRLGWMLDTNDDDFIGQVSGLPEIKDIIVKFPELKIVQDMIGQYRQSTVHAAGIIISSEPVEHYIATLTPTKTNHRVGMVDKYHAQDAGLLKIDMLSVKALSIITKCCDKIGMTINELLSIPLDDPACYALVRDNLVVGNFQLDGKAQNIGYKINVSNFQELYAISALCRPGAMNYVNLYLENKFDEKAFSRYMSKLNPASAEIVKETYGVLLYQEQIIKLCREVAKMEWKDVHKVRKLISASSGIDEYHQTLFVEGMTNNGIKEDEVVYWLNAMNDHGKYSFNKSHCVTYGLVGYWTLWLKKNHPLVFYSTVLEVETEDKAGDGDKLLVKRCINEYRKQGGKIHLLEPATSHQCFSNQGDSILGGWKNIKGIGKVLADKLEANAPYETWSDVAMIMPDGMMLKFLSSGITGDFPWNQKEVIELASWLPVKEIKQEDTDWIRGFNGMFPKDLPNYNLDGQVTVAGYVTLEYKKAATINTKVAKFIWMLEDEETGILITVSKRRMETLGAKMKAEIRNGDFIVVKGSWLDNHLYVNEFYIRGEN